MISSQPVVLSARYCSSPKTEAGVARPPLDGALAALSAGGQLAAVAEPGIHIINAGDGTAAHPSQALLDALTLKQSFEEFSQIRLVMAGDIRHSRVARSAIKMLTLLGIGEIRLAGPPEFVPGEENARL